MFIRGQKITRVSAKGRYNTTFLGLSKPDANGVEYLQLRLDGAKDEAGQQVIQEVQALGFKAAPKLEMYSDAEIATEQARLQELCG